MRAWEAEKGSPNWREEEKIVWGCKNVTSLGNDPLREIDNLWEDIPFSMKRIKKRIPCGYMKLYDNSDTYNRKKKRKRYW